MFSTVKHNQHKARRAALNRFFSMASVRRLQPLIDERVQHLIERIRELKDAKGDNAVMKVNYAFAALTNGKYKAFLSPERYNTERLRRRCDGIRLW